MFKPKPAVGVATGVAVGTATEAPNTSAPATPVAKVSAFGGAPLGAKKEEFSLPSEKKKPAQNLSDYAILVYGQQKIGKTSLTSKFENALHFFFEPSGTDYELFAIEPASWGDFKKAVKALQTTEHQFKNFVIDVVDLAYAMCLKEVSQKLNGTDYPPQGDYGKTWNAVKAEFRDTLIELRRLGGVILVSHALEEKVEVRGGRDYTIIKPSAPKQCYDVVSKWVDLTGFYHISDDGSRHLAITPDKLWDAGSRMETRFKYKDGTPMPSIPMGTSANEAFKNFKLAFENSTEKPKVVEKPSAFAKA
jgi:hypothetical protein